MGTTNGRSTALAVASLVLAACGSPGTADPSTTTSVVTTTVPATAVATTTALTCAPRLQRGCDSEAVRSLQRMLAGAGYGDIASDGIFGPRTEAALDGFERSCGVCTADGGIDIDGIEWQQLAAEVDAVEPDIDYADGFSSFIGGGVSDDCEGMLIVGDLPDEPAFGFGFDLEEPGEPAELVLGARYDLCFVGFDTTAEITLTIDGPSGGRTVTVDPSAPESGRLSGVFAADGPDRIFVGDELTTAFDRLDDPSLPGDYLVTATQGDIVSVRTIRIVTGEFPPGERGMSPVDPDAWSTARSGDTLRFVLIGFPASSEVPLAIYRFTGFDDLGGVFEFVEPLEPAVVGPQGWAYHDVVLPDLEPVDLGSTDYCIATVVELREPFCQPWVDPAITIAG